MEHTPYGYDIVGGKAVINEEQAAKLRKICENYLAGMSLENAAADVGIMMKHTGVKRLLLNRRYLGDDYYPAVFTEEIVQQVDAERERREKALGRDKKKVKDIPKGMIYTAFSAPRINMKYEDPMMQAEYAYSQIRNEVSS